MTSLQTLHPRQPVVSLLFSPQSPSLWAPSPVSRRNARAAAFPFGNNENRFFLLKIVPDDVGGLSGNYTANSLKSIIFPDLANPATSLVIFGVLALALLALSQLRVGKDLFNIGTTEEDIPRSVEQLEEAMKIYKEVPPEEQTPQQATVVEELLREKQELLHERERGLVWLALCTLVVFWCAGLIANFSG